MIHVENTQECFVQLWRLLERTRRLLREQHQRFCIRNVLKVWFGVDATDDYIWEVCHTATLLLDEDNPLCGLDELQPPSLYPRKHRELLRAMETAGKFVEDETLRAAMKENGIGRPSSRAGIIETLFKRHYIRREKKRLVATPTGIELIDLIREELLKSCELTGIWEKKLRDIEAQKYDPQQFINELKAQVTDIVRDVMSDPTNRRITVMPPEEEKKKGKKKS